MPETKKERIKAGKKRVLFADYCYLSNRYPDLYNYDEDGVYKDGVYTGGIHKDVATKALLELSREARQHERVLTNMENKHQIQNDDHKGVYQDFADLINEYRHLCKLHGEYETKHIPQGRYL